MRRLWPAHDPCPALARRQPTACPILCLFAARRLPINRAGRRRAGPKSRASRAVRVPRRCLWTWQDDPAARAMRGASGRAWSLLHGLACCPPAASPSQSSCSIISPSSHGHSQCPSDWPPTGGSFPDRALGHLGVSNSGANPSGVPQPLPHSQQWLHNTTSTPSARACARGTAKWASRRAGRSGEPLHFLRHGRA